MGRPVKEIDWAFVEELIMYGCSGTQIASRLGIHHVTFYDRVQTDHGITFTEYADKFKQKGESLLLEAQFKKALEKDNTMLIWLGKHRLGQKEHDTSHNQAVAERLDKILEAMLKAPVPKTPESTNE